MVGDSEPLPKDLRHKVGDEGLLVYSITDGCFELWRVDAHRVECLEVLHLSDVSPLGEVEHPKHDLDVFF